MRRREFLIRSATAAGAVWLSSKSIFKAIADQALPRRFSAVDTVTLGGTGIKTSRLAMGTGTVGSGHHSHQTALGVKGLSDLLLNGYDHGLRFFDAADSYGSHPHVAEALKHVQRDKVTVLTKSWARDAASMRTDLDRFRSELGTDYLDVCLMHCVTEADWTDRFRGAMDVLSEAKQKGTICPRLLVSLDRGPADRRQEPVGGNRPGAYQSGWRIHGLGSRHGRERAERNEVSREGSRRDEDSRSRRTA
jgi:hypothetical protein